MELAKMHKKVKNIPAMMIIDTMDSMPVNLITLIKKRRNKMKVER